MYIPPIQIHMRKLQLKKRKKRKEKKKKKKINIKHGVQERFYVKTIDEYI